VYLACFCDRPIEEKDHVLSLIPVVDTFTVQSKFESPEDRAQEITQLRFARRMAVSPRAESAGRTRQNPR